MGASQAAGVGRDGGCVALREARNWLGEGLPPGYGQGYGQLPERQFKSININKLKLFLAEGVSAEYMFVSVRRSP